MAATADLIQKRDDESATAFALRKLRHEIMAEAQAVFSGLEPDLSAIKEEHRVGYRAGWRNALAEADGKIEDAKFE